MSTADTTDVMSFADSAPLLDESNRRKHKSTCSSKVPRQHSPSTSIIFPTFAMPVPSGSNIANSRSVRWVDRCGPNTLVCTPRSTTPLSLVRFSRSIAACSCPTSVSVSFVADASDLRVRVGSSRSSRAAIAGSGTKCEASFSNHDSSPLSLVRDAASVAHAFHSASVSPSPRLSATSSMSSMKRSYSPFAGIFGELTRRSARRRSSRVRKPHSSTSYTRNRNRSRWSSVPTRMIATPHMKASSDSSPRPSMSNASNSIVCSFWGINGRSESTSRRKVVPSIGASPRGRAHSRLNPSSTAATASDPSRSHASS
mmetsp:Transcript_11489/g.40064  ORF Transcript_11489/g.40064 Transcript_11489/m.40064 type:complete len:313 (-) Transcript_11489:440-1378(-)